MILDIVITFLVAVAIYQAFKFGRELALHDFMHDHVEAIRMWHVETYRLRQEIKRLQDENNILKFHPGRGDDA